MMSLQAACWDDPEKLLGSQGFCLPDDQESQMAVCFDNAEHKDLLKMKEATGDPLPLFVVNRFDVASVVLRFFEFPVRIKR